MTEIELELRDSHRRWIGSLVQHMRELIEDLRSCGISDELLAELEDRIWHLEKQTQAIASKPPYLVEALLTRLWVDACSLGAVNVESYGALGEDERAYFDDQAGEIERSVHTLSAAISATPTSKGLG